ncbi:thioredoxin [Actinomyces sp. zg-332]|uniref:thioredoxin n=1 Tax=Actinomyces sp. zg-332 TaxID=2708340 RepID=UPI001423C962|nr:thioredoxin [Actinomyces sp. zg-332]QPK94137.1 thioredoxin [Actinomyces sp. zg-332]
MGKALAVTSETFEAEVLKSDVPVLVDFWATWCPPCRGMLPTVEKLAEELEGKAKVVKVDIDESRDLAVKYGVLSVPTFNIFYEGEAVANIVGSQTKQTLLDGINRFISE